MSRKKVGKFEFLPAVRDTFSNDTHKPFDGPDKDAGRINLKKTDAGTWLVAVDAEAILSCPR